MQIVYLSFMFLFYGYSLKARFMCEIRLVLLLLGFILIAWNLILFKNVRNFYNNFFFQQQVFDF